jgi:signal transduction histidine kinase
MLMQQIDNRLLTFNTTDPEDLRRRRLLGILLLSIFVLCIVSLVFTILATVTGNAGNPLEVQLLYYGSIGALVGVIVIYFINRYWKGWVASILFLTLITVVIAFSDEPQQVAVGRSLFLFVIPIIISSVLLRPYAGLVFAVLVSVIIILVGLTVNIVPSVASTTGFIVIGLVSWLTARSLEQALVELRVINQELDQRVAQRTRDLSEALARVQAESSKNQAILESIADGVIVFDQAGKAMVANSSIAQLLNRPVEKIVSADIPTLMGDEVDTADREKVTQLLQQDQELSAPSFTFRWGKKMLSTSFAAVRDSSNKPIGHVMVFRDFTREAELDRMKSAFLSMASHEIRTPLNAVLGYSDMLQEDVYGQLNAEQRKTIERIMANAKRMLALVNNLLDQAQIEAGRISMHIAPFELENLIEDLKLVTAVLAETKGLKLVYEVEKDVPNQMSSDAQRLHQIILNLIGNAIKFTKQGMVGVRVYLQDSLHWAIAVSDTGPGIHPEAQTYIFEAFRQVDDPSTRENMGSGLGLSIVKQLTNLLGGEVKLQSEVGQGSTFTITLPIHPVQEAIA